MNKGKRHARMVAKLYAAEQLRAQDMPEWPVNEGLLDEDDDEGQQEFMAELQRISARIRAQVRQ